MVEMIIQNPSITTNAFEYDEVGRVSAIAGHPLAGEGGGTIVKSDLMWKPTVGDDGYVRWTLASSATIPDAAYISGAQGPAGPQGVSGNPGKNPELQINSTNAHWEWKYSGDAEWTDLGVVASGAVGPQGLSGNNGKDGISPTVSTSVIPGGNRVTFTYGEGSSTYIDVMSGASGANGINGISPTVSTEAIAGGNRVIFTYDNGGTTTTASIDVMSGVSGAKGSDGFSPTVVTADIPVSDQFPAGGTKVTITDNVGPHIFDISNGQDGQGATVTLLGGEGIEVNKAGANYTISVSADYAAKSYVDSASAYALSQAKTWVGEQGFLKDTDLTDYATKTYANDASANALSQAESWVETEGYLKSVSVATNGSIEGTGTTNNPLSLKTSAEQALSAVANKLEPPPHNTQQSTNYIWSDPLGQGIPGWIDANNWLDEVLEYTTEVLHPEDLRWYISPENGVSGKWDNEEKELKLGIDTTNMAANKQYAFTTTGWAEVSTPTIPDITANNGISADGYKIGLTESVYGAIQEISAANDLVGANGISVVAGANNQVIIAPSGISPSKQYAMTITGWAEVQAGTTFTGVTTTGSISGDGLTNPLGLKTSAENALTAVAEKLDITAASQTYLDKTTYATDSATFVTSSNSTITGTDKYALTTSGWASVETAYLPLTGGTVTGQITLTGNSWDNRLTIGRSNTAIDIGVALNGALTLKANANNACQFNMMQTGTSGVDINITYGQTPTAIGNLYVMKTHTTAEATTASGSWNGDNLLHIILDS